MSAGVHRPANPAELADLIIQARGKGSCLECFAGGSKRAIANPDRETEPVDLGAFVGIVDYEPSELVLTVRPATPLVDISTLLAANGQMLAFEPWDCAAVLGNAVGRATIGGTVAAGIAGPRRLTAGGARDHLLGFHAVSGRGEVFKAGGKVVKNVTGFDLSKLIAGSWGQLAIMTELSLKVLPAPRCSATVILTGLDAKAAARAMSAALGSRTSPLAAAHAPAKGAEPSRTSFRLEGFKESVSLRTEQLVSLLADYGKAQPCPDDLAHLFWQSVREAGSLAASPTLWRAHISPSRAASLADALERVGAEWLLDWAGGLVWIGAPADADVRTIVTTHGGHAMLMRAPDEVRRRVPIRHPEAPGVAALSQRLKHAFDPAGVLDPQRFG